MTQDNNDDNKDKLRSHAYDGIQEYDNQLPRWWVQLFWITIIFSGAYLYYYHFRSEDVGLDQEYRVEKKKSEQAALLRPDPSQSITEEKLLALTKDPSVLSEGKALFAEKCLSCHGAHGEGLVGPNLTDNYWIHGSSMKAIVSVIRNGVPAKGMIPWASLMTADQIHASAAYIKSIQGTQPKNPKAPEGKPE